MKLEFWTIKRRNVFAKNGNEHVLYCQIGDDSPFVIAEYGGDPPTKKELKQAKSIAHRAMEFYHRSIRWPKFDVEEWDDCDIAIEVKSKEGCTYWREVEDFEYYVGYRRK